MKKTPKVSQRRRLLEGNIQQATLAMALKDVSGSMVEAMGRFAKVRSQELPAIVSQAKEALGVEVANQIFSGISGPLDDLIRQIENVATLVENQALVLSGEKVPQENVKDRIAADVNDGDAAEAPSEDPAATNDTPPAADAEEDADLDSIAKSLVETASGPRAVRLFMEHLTSRKSLLECVRFLEEHPIGKDSKILAESAPPSPESESWIKKNKAAFKKRYGKNAERILYATAWKIHNKKKKDD
jgi:hypothetical protein